MKPALKIKALNDTVECWDDDEDFADISKFESNNRFSSKRGLSRELGSSRNSLASESSFTSFRSDRREDEPSLPDTKDVGQSVSLAIASGLSLAKKMPALALLGGSIHNLGSKKQHLNALADWGDDIDLPSDGNLELKKFDVAKFPSSFSDGSSTEDSIAVFDEDDEDDMPTIRGPRKVTPKVSLISVFDQPNVMPQMCPQETPPDQSQVATSHGGNNIDSIMDVQHNSDRQIGFNGIRPDLTTPPPSFVESDVEESGEGSLGTRRAGRHRRRNDSVSSILSPSVSSSFTFDSEDESFTGIELPENDFNFNEVLETKKQLRASQIISATKTLKQRSRDDFLEGLELNGIDPFKSPTNQNVKQTKIRAPLLSPSKRAAATPLTFSQKHSQLYLGKSSRRLSSNPVHTLEPVAENSGRTMEYRRKSEISPTRHVKQERDLQSQQKGGFTTVRRREALSMNDKQKALRSQKSTPNLKSHGSSPMKLRQPLPPPIPTAMRIPRPSSRLSDHSSNKDQPTLVNSKPNPKAMYNSILKRPTSRNDQLPTQLPRPSSRASMGRPGSKNSPRSDSGDRQGATSRASNHGPQSRPSSRLSTHSRNADRSKSPRRSRTPLEQEIPALPTTSPAHQGTVATKPSRIPPPPSTLTSSHIPAPVPRKHVFQGKKTSLSRALPNIAPPSLRHEAAATNTLRVPLRKRNFGTGQELEIFDDLPTISKSLLDDRDSSTIKASKQNVRTGTEYKLAITPATQSSLIDKSFHRRSIDMRAGEEGQSPRKAKKRQETLPPQRRPRLIKAFEVPKAVEGVQSMKYNSQTFRWEGNELDSEPFEERSNLPTNLPRPALIASIKSAKNVQVVGRMVFDPAHMCWLKVDNTAPGKNDEEEEEDPFGGIEDLDDGTSATPDSTTYSSPSERFQDSILAEEFDVGPEFIRRQKEEEERWRNKVKGWISTTEATKSSRAWDLREIAIASLTNP